MRNAMAPRTTNINMFSIMLNFDAMAVYELPKYHPAKPRTYKRGMEPMKVAAAYFFHDSLRTPAATDTIETGKNGIALNIPIVTQTFFPPSSFFSYFLMSSQFMPRHR